MGALLKVLLAGFALFMAAAAVQEWDSVVVPLVRGRPAPAPVPRGEAPEAEEAVRQFVLLSEHLRQSGGDARFAERLPASPELVDELMAEIAYLQHRGIQQRSRLVKLEVVGAEPRGSAAAEVRTREYWVFRVHAGGATTDEQVISQVLSATYRVRLDGSRWRVAQWELTPGSG